MYTCLSQHKVIAHKTANKEERKVLLAIESGRIKALPILACGKFSNRLDHHICAHGKILVVAQDDALMWCKRRAVITKVVST